ISGSSKPAQERHDALVLFPSSTGFDALYLAASKRSGFHLKIDLRVDVGCVQRNVAHPCAYRVDIHAGAKEVGCGCVADAMGADLLGAQRREAGSDLLTVTFDQPVNAEACNGPAVPIQ